MPVQPDQPDRILLTGFEPFGGEDHNPSWPAARDAAGSLRERGLHAVAVRLPCAFADSTGALDAALRRHRPTVAIACGLAGGLGAVAVERVAVNLQDARIPDNAGHQPAGEPVDDAGPAAWFSTLPVKRTVAALTDAGIPATLSLSAGSFVCNHVFYRLMQRAAAPAPAPATGAGPPPGPLRAAGFIHLPWDAGNAPGAEPALPAGLLAGALEVAALQALDPAPDLRRADGTLH
jgi:pyroglutamyl-peptidase